jgi:hypothetical protein
MKTVIVSRHGEVKLRIPVEERNGILRAGQNILINNDLIRDPHTKESVAAAIKAHKITAEIEAMGMRIGDNGNGLICTWADEHDKAARDAALAALTDALRERMEISKLFAAAERRLNDTDDCNTMDHYRMMAQARAKLEAWQLQYPADAKKEKADALRAKAADKRDLARGALAYDADGWLNEAARQKRHDDIMAEADELEKQAVELEK